ncbi:hypothetical protein CJ030_MR2G001315 [Morella rubra]|uniref:PHD-type domain-containing protein n=1 Tax=Morella rubra TaxID=262757 RepID=A0A6A1WFG4_9ROSI|nr:hypothetical protein CJ030_MR2G001315 [Morella rubra]
MSDRGRRPKVHSSWQLGLYRVRTAGSGGVLLDTEGREGIDSSKVPKKRCESKCYVCKGRNGCAIQWFEPNYPLAFHVTCGLKEDRSLYREQRREEERCYCCGICKNHTELWNKVNFFVLILAYEFKVVFV